MAPPIQINRRTIFMVAFFALLVGLLSLLFSLMEPFLRSFVWATLFVMVFYPVYDRLLRWTRGQDSIAAVLATLFVMFCLALPGFFIFVNLGRELPNAFTLLSSTSWDEKSQWVMAELQSLDLEKLLQTFGVGPDQAQAIVQRAITAAVQDFGHMILAKVDFLFKHVAQFALEMIFTLVAMFFFFRDGARYALKAIELLPLEKEYQVKVVRTFSATVTAVMRAMFISAFVQGVLTCVGLVLTGVPLPFLFGIVAFINSFIPFLGAASVWVPSVIWLFVQGQMTAAILLLVWGILISIFDHIFRPWLIGSAVKLPVFGLFFTIIGGLLVYGFLGIFLGPIILSMGMAFLAIYQEVYLNRKAPAVKPEPASASAKRGRGTPVRRSRG
jgi:predicted PurR-regulated permease PerM